MRYFFAFLIAFAVPLGACRTDVIEMSPESDFWAFWDACPGTDYIAFWDLTDRGKLKIVEEEGEDFFAVKNGEYAVIQVLAPIPSKGRIVTKQERDAVLTCGA